MTRLMILAALAVVLSSPEASAACNRQIILSIWQNLILDRAEV